MGSTTLYRFFDEQGTLLYVGVTSDPGRRFAQHASDKPWWSQVASSTMEHLPSRQWALVAELRAIRAEAPLFNKNGTVSTTWHVLCDLEPKLVDLERWAQSAAVSFAIGHSERDLTDLWYGLPRDEWQPGGGVKDKLRQLVGPGRGEPMMRMSGEVDLSDLDVITVRQLRLDTDEAYRVAYHHLYQVVSTAWAGV